jgi:alpha-methylacyl-CoA racemase
MWPHVRVLELVIQRPGALHDVRILEFASLGPGPMAAMILADLGADIIRLERPAQPGDVSEVQRADRRGRPSVAVELKTPAGARLAKRLAGVADVIIEGFRPGVMERIGLGPQVLLDLNPRLVYARMTGYGQDGPLASVPGHDINYISIAGALGQFARTGEKPMFPLNLLGDYGGGAMFLVTGILAALIEARRSGHGQVVDVAMVDGVALLTTAFHEMRGTGMWRDEVGTNLLDSGAPFYEVYETADGSFVSVGAIEPRFHAALLACLGIPAEEMPQWDRQAWPAQKRRLAATFKLRTQDEWIAVFDGSEACVTPVLSFEDAPRHPHNVARHTFLSDGDGPPTPAPAPRFSRTPGDARRGVPTPMQALEAWGVSASENAA